MPDDTASPDAGDTASLDAPASLVIEYVDPATLTPDPENPREITPEQRKKLKAGIARFGFVGPLLARTEDRVVIGGHQRTAIAMELGMATVPVVFRAGLTANEARALNILLNNPKAQGSWDNQLLVDNLSAMQADGFDIDITGFDESDLVKFMAKFEPPTAFAEKDENIETEHKCPSCGYQWSGSAT